MAQIIVTFAPASVYGKAPTYSPYGVKTVELASSGTAAPSTVYAAEGDHCRITNNGTSGSIWAVVGRDVTATVAIATGFNVPFGQTIDLGPCVGGDRASVIDDS